MYLYRKGDGEELGGVQGKKCNQDRLFEKKKTIFNYRKKVFSNLLDPNGVTKSSCPDLSLRKELLRKITEIIFHRVNFLTERNSFVNLHTLMFSCMYAFNLSSKCLFNLFSIQYSRESLKNI